MKNNLKPSMDWIIYDDNPKLKEKSEEVVFPISELEKETIEKMVSYIDASYYDEAEKYNIKPGIGMAAVQMGLMKKIIYIHFDDNEIEHKYLLANPKVIKEFSNNSFIKSGEGCLSVKEDVEGYSIRKSKIIVEAINLYDNQKITIEADSFLSSCLQHEIDHLNGILFYDRINKFNPFYSKPEWEEI